MLAVRVTAAYPPPGSAEMQSVEVEQAEGVEGDHLPVDDVIAGLP
jgi:hypothetical protein